MSLPIICIRAEPGCTETVERGRNLGLQIEAMPMFGIKPVTWELPDPAGLDGLLIGSANAIRHGGTKLAGLLDLPVFAVGKTTAAMANNAGFQVAHIGGAGLQSLLDQLAGQRLHLLRLSGEKRVPLTISANQKIDEIVVYRSTPVPAPPALAQYARHGAVAVLHSASAAEHFARELTRLGGDPATFTIAALAPRIADAAGLGWAKIAISPEPDDAALLAMVANMCK